ncbi:MAG: hypothetical protein KC931_24920, partial [Candidatus Omnitrophica bacterium]|nr:hypothetical protein [Candidatus Omnitrophota bacterium]
MNQEAVHRQCPEEGIDLVNGPLELRVAILIVIVIIVIIVVIIIIAGVVLVIDPDTVREDGTIALGFAADFDGQTLQQILDSDGLLIIVEETGVGVCSYECSIEQ